MVYKLLFKQLVSSIYLRWYIINFFSVKATAITSSHHSTHWSLHTSTAIQFQGQTRLTAFPVITGGKANAMDKHALLWLFIGRLFCTWVNLFYLRLRDNTQRLYVAKHLPLQSGTYRDTGFFNGQSSITWSLLQMRIGNFCTRLPTKHSHLEPLVTLKLQWNADLVGELLY